MTTIDREKFETKLAITEVAVELYIKQGGSFSLKAIAEELDLTVAEIFNYFPNKREILKFYYASLVFRYQMMVDEIEDFDTYMLSEKLSNFAYASFDMLKERKTFVEATFEKLIIYSYEKTQYEKEVEKLLKKFIENDALVSSSSAVFLNQCTFSFLRRQYLSLVRFWLNDDSEDYELSMELTDKLTNFMQEIMYSAVLDKGFDLVKFLASNSKAFLQNIPFAKNIFSKIEIR